jgi:DNA ligase-4
MLEKHWRDYRPQNPPPHLVLAEPFKEKPDVWIDPRVSKILQVKAAQIVISEKYKAGYTLRFPRVVKIRTDKSWYDCLDLDGFLEVAKQFGGRYARRKIGEIEDIQESDKKRRKVAPSVKKVLKKREEGEKEEEKKKKLELTVDSQSRIILDHFKDTDTSNVEQISGLFGHLEFCKAESFC